MQNSLNNAQTEKEGIKKTEVWKQGTTKNDVAQNSRSIIISIRDLFEKINPKDANFLKYVPDQFLNNEQIKAKNRVLNHEKENFVRIKNKSTQASELTPPIDISNSKNTFSGTIISQNHQSSNTYSMQKDKNNSENGKKSLRNLENAYETIGELDRLKKRNEKLELDVLALKKALQLTKQQTHGKMVNPSQVRIAAGMIRRNAGSPYCLQELTPRLVKLFGHCVK